MRALPIAAVAVTCLALLANAGGNGDPASEIEAGGSAEGLAQSADIAIERLAKASGRPSGASGGRGGAAAGIVVALGSIVLGVVGAFWVRRRAPAGPMPPGVS